MGCQIKSRKVVDPQTQKSHEVQECTYSIEDVHEQLTPELLDRDVSTYTEIEKGSFAYAIQKWQSGPHTFERFFESEIPTVRERMQRVYETFGKKQSQPSNTVWIHWEDETRDRILYNDGDPDFFLAALASQIESWFTFSEGNETKSFRINISTDSLPPSGPYEEIVLTDTDRSLTDTRQRRILAIQDVLMVGRKSRIDALNKVFRKIRAQQTGISLEDLYDQAAQDPESKDYIFLAAGWAPMKSEDVGNHETRGIAYVSVDASKVEDPFQVADYALVASHELGHLLGLEHARGGILYYAPSLLMSIKGDTIFMKQDMNNAYYNPETEKWEVSATRSLLDVVWGGAAVDYLKVALGYE